MVLCQSMAAQHSCGGQQSTPGQILVSTAMPPPRRESVLEWFTVPVLWLTLLVPGWIIVASFWPRLPRFSSDEVEAVIVLTLIGLSLGLVCLVAWLHTQPRQVTKTILSPAESHRENTV
jgi:hypothetical protein